MSRASRPSLVLPLVLAVLLAALLALRGSWVDIVAVSAIVVALAVLASTAGPSRRVRKL
jgi:hypothetical protein